MGLSRLPLIEVWYTWRYCRISFIQSAIAIRPGRRYFRFQSPRRRRRQALPGDLPRSLRPGDQRADGGFQCRSRPRSALVQPAEIVLEAEEEIVPVLANRQGIEGVVYLELFIDETGEIKRIDILQEPGFGLGEAAAFDGVTVAPAESNGVPVAVRFRYPVRF